MIDMFLVDDHEAVHRGHAELLDNDPNLRLTGDASSYAQVVAKIPALRPDVTVLGVRLPDGNEREPCRKFLSKLPGLRCVILTRFDDDPAMLAAILGAKMHQRSPRT